ncbi:energy transducer TonB [Lysobacter enzymogenes]|uniref:Periplasmic protein TonB n=1 Tax=Lysobacter enzymogenes TaxID=69 RepID=A0AAU9ADT0_LYSEN|nr:energy transducer TonB [Lysobacter enzymogenes]BAV97192.1 periplasmic protein TonB [Lysobacter enzymogenes]
MVRTLPSHHARPPLDGTRIAANAGAIAFNAAMLMLMLAPLSAPQLITQPLDQTIIEFVPRPKLVDPPPPPPKKDPPLRQVVKDPPPRVQQVAPQPVAPPQIVVDQPAQAMDFQGSNDVVASIEPPVNVGRQIIEGATLQVLRNPPPSYPIEAVRAGITGTVELEILVGIDGKPIDVLIVRSSGNRALDQAARKVVLQRWAFQPAMENGQAVQARGRVPIEFKLDRQ